MKNLSLKWQKLIVWLTGYLSIIAFVIAGGYLYKNSEHEEIKTSAKVTLFVTAVFTAIDIVRLIIQNCVYMAHAASSWLNTFGWVVSLVKAVVFVILFIVDMTVGMGKQEKSEETDEGKTELNKDGE